MAQLRDIPAVTRTMGLVPFAKKVWYEILDDNLFTWAAALAYSWLFAVFPFFLFLLTLLPYLPAEWTGRAREEVKRLVYTTAPGTEAADVIWTNIDHRVHDLLQHQGTLLPRLLSLGLALWAASGGMAMTMAALDKCYEVEKGRRFYQQRPGAAG